MKKLWTQEYECESEYSVLIENAFFTDDKLFEQLKQYYIRGEISLEELKTRYIEQIR